MNQTTTFLVIVIAVLVIGALWFARRRGSAQRLPPVYGANPAFPKAVSQGSMPTLKMPTAKGWEPGQKPTTAPGLKVTAFAAKLRHPRWIYVLPNGDVLIAESATQAGKVRSITDFVAQRTMRRAGALQESANQITLLRDADGDGVPEVREVFLSNLSQPFGMALVGDTLYVGNTDAVVAFPYETGQTRISAPGRTVMTMKPGGHWTRNLLASPDGSKLYVAVGSLSNIGDSGLEAEEGRALIFELDLATEQHRVFASGLRNPVGMAWQPDTGSLWTVVNERDGLGDETPPDYLTSVKDGGFYGWPFSYWGQTVDDRVEQDAALVARASTPDYALGGHTASLGLCWAPAGTLAGMPEGMVIGQHGSWNRSKLSGYKVILVPFVNGKPQGAARDLLTGFLADDEKFSHGRPVGVTIAKDGALLAVDDVGDSVWRVTAA